MKILFIGSVNFSHSALLHLISLKAEIVGVCTLRSSDNNSDYYDLREVCKENNIPYIYVNEINSDDTTKWIESKKPDILFCFGWSKLLKERILNIAPKGAVGYHPAALPANRGRHPIIWALALGLKKTASTFFLMNEKVDAGDIISQREIEITEEDDAGSLYSKITCAAKEQMTEFLPTISSGSFISIKQEESSSNIWRKRAKEDGKIDWRMSAISIHRLVKALTRPYPAAHFIYQDTEVKVWKTEICDYSGSNIEPGKVLSIEGDRIIVKCGDKAIALLETDPSLNLSVGSYL